MLDQFGEASSVYNMPITYNFEDLDLDVFQKAFMELMERHESLRTTIVTVEGQPRQKINRLSDFKPAFSIACIDLRNVADNAKVFDRICAEESAKPFNLEKGPLVRPVLFRMTDRQYIFLLNHHHIISDAWSLRVMENDFSNIYAALLTKGYNDLPALPIQYKDYTAWQNELLRNDHFKESRAYWLNEFSGELPVLDMTYERPRPAVKTYNGGKVALMTDLRTKEALKQTCMKQDASVFMGLLACINVLLYRYTGQQDIVIGTPYAGRDQGELEDQVGFYVNTLAIRTKFRKEWTFAELLAAVKRKTMEAYEFSSYPFDVLVDQLQLAQDLSRMPLFDVMLSIQHVQAEKRAERTNENSILYSTVGGTSKFDLTFTVDELDKGLLVEIEYNTDLFSKERIERLAMHFSNLLAAAGTTPGLPLYKYLLFTPAETKKLLNGLHGPTVDYPYYKTLPALFEEQVAKTPEQVAIVYGDMQLTYQQLNRHANQLAYHLQTNYAIKRNDLVGVMLQRTEWMPVVLLAILKSGGAYVPYDPAYPADRVLFMINDSRCRLLITDNVLPEIRAQFKDLPVLDLSELKQQIAHHPADNLPATSSFEDLAYIIYTSGSTGLPKGVELTHRNAVALVCWAQAEYEASVYDIVYAVTSYCFDLSVYEIFFSLCSGKKLRILESGLSIPDWIEQDRNVLVNTVPSVVQHLLNQGMSWENVSVLNMAGEPIPLPVKERLNIETMEVRNLYGPSEYATYSTCYRFGQEHSIIPIGKPLQNTQVYILDDMLNLVPEGTKGEICIAGEQLAMGYINRTQLTSERFVPNIKDPAKKMYRTGDLGRWLPDGNIEFFGRKDYQVKVRGYRIELGEIENTMNRYPGVEESAVIVRQVANENNLCAFYTGKMDTEGLHQHLASMLPSYMMPAQLTYLEAMPLTPNRKIDRKALQLPQYMQGSEKEDTVVMPSNPLEEKLVEIWREVLERDRVSVKDNFFKIGGHSLKATLVASRLYREFGKQIRIRDIFTYPTVEKLAEMLNGIDAVKTLPPVNKKVNARAEVNIDIQVDGLSKAGGHVVRLNKYVEHAAPMLLIPSVVGLPEMFAGLAENLEGQFNCYGLRYPGIDGGAMPETIPSIARHVYKELSMLPPADHLVIAGYSMGALIAFELAKVLEQKGMNVKLVLLDKDCKTEKSAFSQSLPEADSPETLFGVDIARWVKQQRGLDFHKLKTAFRHHMVALDEYIIDGKVNAELITFEANFSTTRTQMQLWSRYTNGHFEHHLLACDHQSLLNYENTEIIAGILKEVFVADKVGR